MTRQAAPSTTTAPNSGMLWHPSGLRTPGSAARSSAIFFDDDTCRRGPRDLQQLTAWLREAITATTADALL